MRAAPPLAGQAGRRPAESRPLPETGPEAALSAAQFAFLRDLLKRSAGIVLAEHKQDMAVRRLAKRLRVLGLPDFEAYCALLASAEGQDERGQMINALTTNQTKFFREAHHFAHLAETALPRLANAAGCTRRVRLWSAGCSSGEEPYSIAMVLHQALPDLARWDARILASDIDTEMIARARRGEYDARAVETIPPALFRRFVEPAADEGFRIKDVLKASIAFKPLNLLGPWPMKGPFDVIFCRNVVIYFDKPTQRELFDRFADILRPDGFLYIGHSESLYRVSERFRLVGQSIYQKMA